MEERAVKTRESTRTTRPSLRNALATETDPFLVSRYTFYLAQSYRDCGEREKSLANYLKRADLGFWNEEVYVSLLRGGQPYGGAGTSVR